MKDFVTDILICKVSYNWYQVIKSDYIINGSSVINCWYTDEEESKLGLEAHEQLPAPGSLALFLVEKTAISISLVAAFICQDNLCILIPAGMNSASKTDT